MRIQLSDHFTYQKLLRFTIPSIIMMVCTSIYSIVDGLFVSNFVGKTEFAALNLIMPFIMALSTVGFMIGTGGSAIVAIHLGEGKKEEANQYFSMLIYLSIFLGVIVSTAGFLFMRPIAYALGATDTLIEHCVIYGRISMISLTFFMLQIIFQSFFVTAEKPELSLRMSLAAGFTNVVLDFLFIVVFQWGLPGAALATVSGEIIGGSFPLIYFSRKNSSLLRFTKTHFYGNILLKTCTNGSSELMTNIATSIVNILYNFQLMKYAGEDGVAAYGVIMYALFIFIAVYFGYSIGVAPVIGYHHGAQNHSELKNLVKKSLVLISFAGVVLTLLSQILAGPLSAFFVGYDTELYKLTYTGLRLYALCFLINGFNIWGSSLFTALGNGVVSAVISFLRALVFQTSMVMILPLFLDVNGIWLAIVAAELLALIVTGAFFIMNRQKYHYI